MTSKTPIKIDIFEFVAHGVFGGVVLGQDKQHIMSGFPKPDDEFITIYNMCIWSYGNLEFHFDENNKLFLIWCDRFQEFSGGASLEVSPWLIRYPYQPRLPEIIDSLTRNRISSSLTFNREQGSANIRIMKSKVDLHFEPNMAFENKVGYDSAEYNCCGADEFELKAFGLIRET